jgi:protein tyrosine phosphatase (PTP) superfamily phosphohydrolase (DUF442 family)
MQRHLFHCGLLAALLACWPASADNTLEDIINYRLYSPLFSSSGQPTAAQLEQVAKSGFKRVIYLAFNDDSTAIEKEDRVVKQQGMDYVQIPVDFDKPTLDDF